MKNFWDERYSKKEYIYGTEPNSFFKKELAKLDIGKLLLPAEGEGRNAVYAATHGWDVIAFDSSFEARRKALALAEKFKVIINYTISDFDNFSIEANSVDCIALIYAHVPKQLRKNYHEKLVDFLKPGGTLILEGFSKKQLNNDSGGPKNIELLFSKEELSNDFSSLSDQKIVEETTNLKEGKYHNGIASVIRLVGKKK